MRPCTLRWYQIEAIDALRASFATRHRAPLLQLPTGGGKTIIFSHVTAGAAAKQRRVLVVAHRRELLRQASAKLADAGVPHGIIAAGFPPAAHEPVQVASIQTLARRLDTLPTFDLVVIDEAHHSIAGQYASLIAAQPKAKLLGVTATPARLDGRGLGIGAGGPFDDLLIGPPIKQLVSEGFLCPARCFVPAEAPDLRGVRSRGGDYDTADLAGRMTGAITGDAVEQYRRRADHQPAIAFCVSIAHAEAVAATFRDAGYRAVAASGDTPIAERDAAIAGLATGAVEILCACDLVSEGLDVPTLNAVILLRPTKSLPLFMQQVGRGMRPALGKSGLTVLDHAGNIATHGMPDADREWSLDAGVVKQRRRGAAASVWRCPQCGCLNSIAIHACEGCGEVRAGRTVEMVPGELVEAGPTWAERMERAERLSYREVMNSRLSMEELRAFARARGYRRGWAAHRLKEQAGSDAEAAA